MPSAARGGPGPAKPTPSVLLPPFEILADGLLPTQDLFEMPDCQILAVRCVDHDDPLDHTDAIPVPSA
jgi:hypothetical protein